MKKILFVLLAGMLLAGAFGVMESVSAVEKTKDCCVLRSTIEIDAPTAANPKRVVRCVSGNEVGADRVANDNDGTPGFLGCGGTDCTTAIGCVGWGGTPGDCIGLYETAFTAAERQKVWGIMCTLSMVHNVTDWVFYFVLILAVLMLVIGGAFYITAAGDPEKAGRGKMILTLSVVGLVIAVIAKLIPSLVRFFVGM